MTGLRKSKVKSCTIVCTAGEQDREAGLLWTGSRIQMCAISHTFHSVPNPRGAYMAKHMLVTLEHH